ncbi:MAG: molybdenum cofactor guanylyltransferase MobA [Alphaproteobacteria bacterium]|nr:molybdenum cofactor guanylyltransferase MobA [Alphaproteobacteria bacterium]
MGSKALTSSPSILGVILAGGQARRLGGGDKALHEVAGKTLLAHAIGRLQPQVSCVVINANGDASRFADFSLPVVADTVGGFAGPLAGVLAGLDWAAECAPECDWVVTVATDAPFFPDDLVVRLLAAVHLENADLVCAESGGRVHPVFGLWPVSLRNDLRSALVDEEIRKVDLWTARHRLAVISFPVSVIDPFFNINRPEDIRAASKIFSRLKAKNGYET